MPHSYKNRVYLETIGGELVAEKVFKTKFKTNIKCYISGFSQNKNYFQSNISNLYIKVAKWPLLLDRELLTKQSKNSRATITLQTRITHKIFPTTTLENIVGQCC